MVLYQNKVEEDLLMSLPTTAFEIIDIKETPYRIWAEPVKNSTQASPVEMGSTWLRLHKVVGEKPFDVAAVQMLIAALKSLAEADGKACQLEFFAVKADVEIDLEFDPYDRDMYLHRIEQELQNLSLKGDTFISVNDFVCRTATSYAALQDVMTPAARKFFDELELDEGARSLLEGWSRSQGRSSVAWVSPMTGNLLAAYRGGLAQAIAEYERAAQ